MRRREFVTLAGAFAAWPLAARAQQAAAPLIGYLGSASPESWADRVRAFRDGLAEAGYFDGRNVAIEFRWSEGKNDRLPMLAAELVRRQVTVIAAPGNARAALAAKAATTSIPIVFYVGGDPVATGLVESLNRPSGNLTGITNLSLEIAPKRIEILHELVPTATAIAQLVNPTSAIATELSSTVHAAASKLGMRLDILHASTVRDIEIAFETINQSQPGALVIGPDPFFNARSEQLAALALLHAIPTISEFRDFPAAGGLLSYGASNIYAHRLVGIYTGRILKGEKPSDLPVQRATKVELVINLKTAKVLGLTVPPTLLARADEVIE